LQGYAAAKENEIRDVCSSNYQEFVDSIEEIVRMKADVSKLQVRRVVVSHLQIVGAVVDVVVLLFAAA
jgi:fructose-1,6-bisphosphatase